MGQMLGALRYSDFRVLWISTVSNQLGQGMQQVLLGWLVFVHWCSVTLCT